uniref:Uncharacterized protein n=1 Tax=Arundo donax TaxID=35708 RepID=A0A0A9CF68_ARUDO
MTKHSGVTPALVFTDGELKRPGKSHLRPRKAKVVCSGGEEKKKVALILTCLHIILTSKLS